MAIAAPEPYLRPTTLDDALAALADAPRLVVAGGTDVYPAHATRPLDRPVLDISRVSGLRGITRDAGGSWRFGATTTWTDVAEADELPSEFDGLRAAARQVGGRQIQNAGTVAGNIVNASPAADGTPNLLALDAIVESSSVRGVRRMPLAEFATGYRATALAPDELVTAVVIPSIAGAARSAFHKLGSRAYLVISIVSVAVVMVVEDGRIADARVAVGACSPVPLRLAELERALIGAAAGGGRGSAASLVAPVHLEALSPIDDVRAPADYRREAALTVIRRALAEATG